MTEESGELDAQKLSESERLHPPALREPAPTGVHSAPGWDDLDLALPDAVPAPVKKERLFSRKVLIGWALLTLAAYFGLRVITTVVKESVRQAVTSRGLGDQQGKFVIVLPNGSKITINRDGNAKGPIPEIVLPKPPEPVAPQIPPALPTPVPPKKK